MTKTIGCSPDLDSFQFRKIITRYTCIGYNLNVMRQTDCMLSFQHSHGLIIMMSSSIACRWVGRQTLANRRFNCFISFAPDFSKLFGA